MTGTIQLLSSTSLLHSNCIFNRNNTVATHQGMKTYWLCKSYRITMCRARCITHQGRLISTTGSHNHAPHIKATNTNQTIFPNTPNFLMQNPTTSTATIDTQQNVDTQMHPQPSTSQMNPLQMNINLAPENFHLSDSDFESMLNSNTSTQISTGLQITPINHSNKNPNQDLSNMFLMGSQVQPGQNMMPHNQQKH